MSLCVSVSRVDGILWEAGGANRLWSLPPYQPCDHGQLSQHGSALISSPVKWGEQQVNEKDLEDIPIHRKDLRMMSSLLFLEFGCRIGSNIH